MTQPLNPDLIALATPYALHALTDSELADVERRVAAAPPEVARGIRGRGARRARDDGGGVGGDGCRATRPAARPTPGHRQRDPVRQLSSKRATRWRTTILSAAAVLAIGLGALGVGTLPPAAGDVDR